MKASIKNQMPTILTCLGGVGVVFTSVLTAKATPKALRLIDETEREKGVELSKWEKVRVTAPVYIPPVIIGSATIICIFGSNLLSKRQQASLASAYAFLDQTYKKYQRKVIELYGEDTHKKIIDSIAIEEAQEVCPYTIGLCNTSTQCLEEDYSDPILFYEPNGRTYFESPLEQVLMAEYYINRDMVLGMTITLNDLYFWLGLDPTDYGETVGWTLMDEIYWIDFNHRKINLEDGRSCYVIETPYGPSAEALSDEYY